MTSFGGRRMMVGVQNGSKLDMKKGKANVPPQMRGQYKKQQEMAEMRRQVMEASQPGSDGLPVFNLYVRTKRQNVSLRYTDTMPCTKSCLALSSGCTFHCPVL